MNDKCHANTKKGGGKVLHFKLLYIFMVRYKHTKADTSE